MNKDFGKDLIKEVVIDDMEYLLYIWNPEKALKWVRRCQEIIFKPIAAALGTNITAIVEADLANINLDLEKTFNAYLSAVNEKDYVNYLKELVLNVSYKSKEITFDTHFRGKILHLHKLAFAVLEYQLADFFDVAREGATKYLSQMQKKDCEASTTETSIGQFGDSSEQISEAQEK